MSAARTGGSGRFGRELLVRVASALVLLAVSITLLWLGGWFFTALAVVSAVLILHEWVAMTGPYDRKVVAWASIAFVGVTVALSRHDPLQSLIAMALVAVGIGYIGLTVERRMSWLSAGIVYATLPAVAAVALREAGDGLLAVVFVFVVVWATDTSAYFSGRLIGGPKLAPRFSPKKTWAGAIGGALAAVVAGLVIARAAGLPAGLWIAVISLALSVVSQTGDLAESAMKRHFDIKDSGALIPGHGGIMDRVDGLTAALVFAALLGILHGALLGSSADIASGLLRW